MKIFGQTGLAVKNMNSKFSWDQLRGLSESQAEALMIQQLGHIPDQWNNPVFRDEVTGIRGQAELEAHMNAGEQAYGGQSRLGNDAKKVWYQRNIAGQGYPGLKNWLNRKKE